MMPCKEDSRKADPYSCLPECVEQKYAAVKIDLLISVLNVYSREFSYCYLVILVEGEVSGERENGCDST